MLSGGNPQSSCLGGNPQSCCPGGTPSHVVRGEPLAMLSNEPLVMLSGGNPQSCCPGGTPKHVVRGEPLVMLSGGNPQSCCLGETPQRIVKSQSTLDYNPQFKIFVIKTCIFTYFLPIYHDLAVFYTVVLRKSNLNCTELFKD